MNKPTDNRLYNVRVFSEIGRKWVKHLATIGGVRKPEAQKLISTFKEVKGEIVPFTPDRPVEAIDWLTIPAVAR
jgi:hypothetical protein